MVVVPVLVCRGDLAVATLGSPYLIIVVVFVIVVAGVCLSILLGYHMLSYSCCFLGCLLIHVMVVIVLHGTNRT